VIRAYKIVEIVDGEVRTLFHGLNGSRNMPRGVWLKALIRPVRDGSSGTWYMSGWHVFRKLVDCYHYKDKFTSRLELLRCVPCHVRLMWLKQHSPSPVVLAKWIFFLNRKG